MDERKCKSFRVSLGDKLQGKGTGLKTRHYEGMPKASSSCSGQAEIGATGESPG
jgi:hypothetical protein